MKKMMLTLLVLLGLSTASLSAANATPSIGVVNFATCISDSKYGKNEQASFETLKKQMSSLLEDTEKQLMEINAKFNDAEYLDGLSPEAEGELKAKFQNLSEEMNRYQNQYYQVMNQANMRIYQVMGVNINSASEAVAKDKKFQMVLNKEACFFYSPDLDITNLIISEMDKRFDEEKSKQEDAVKKVMNDEAVKAATAAVAGEALPEEKK